MPSDEVYFIDADPTAPGRPASAPRRAGRMGLFGRRAPSDATLAADTAALATGGRRPLIAATLSLLVCGAGQLYNGQRDLALLYFATEVWVAAADWCLWKIWAPLAGLLGLFDIQRGDMMLVTAACNYLFLLFIGVNALQAFRDAAGMEPTGGLRRPLVSSLASLALPGWGQFLNAQPLKGALLLGLFLSGAYLFALSLVFPGLWGWDSSVQQIFDWRLSNGGLAGLATAIVVYLAAFYDALLVARRERASAI